MGIESVNSEPVNCRCGTEMELRVEGTERTLTVGSDGNAVEFRVYVCPACHARQRREYDAAAGGWQPVE